MTDTPRKAKHGSQRRQRSRLAGMACTPDERAALDAAAERAGLSVSSYMRQQCLGAPGPRAARRPPVERAALAQLLGQIGKCGSNLNQIARALNSGQARTDREIATAVTDMREAALAISRMLRGGRP